MVEWWMARRGSGSSGYRRSGHLAQDQHPAPHRAWSCQARAEIRRPSRTHRCTACILIRSRF